MTIELVEPPLESNAQVIKDIIGGTMGGIAQVLVGQPFDTVKVRLQSAPDGTYSGATDVVKRLVSTEGVKGFYKGTLTPLIGVGACVSVQFLVNEYMKRYYDLMLNGQPMLLVNFFTGGAVAGFANGFLASPIEHVRIRLQTQSNSLKAFSGPIDCVKKIYSTCGIRGIYKGFAPTLARESIGLGVYFATYEALIARQVNVRITRGEIPLWKLCMFGGLSGYTLWLTIYPIDVIKSKLQTDRLVDPKYAGSFLVVRDIAKTSGIKGFYRGFAPTILRAAPANGATFAVFEVTMRLLSEM